MFLFVGVSTANVTISFSKRFKTISRVCVKQEYGKIIRSEKHIRVVHNNSLTFRLSTFSELCLNNTYYKRGKLSRTFFFFYCFYTTYTFIELYYYNLRIFVVFLFFPKGISVEFVVGLWFIIIDSTVKLWLVNSDNSSTILLLRFSLMSDD